jgi:hypothetical protein
MSVRHLNRLGNQIRISIPQDEQGFVGRECPQPDCLGYFKIQVGTGLTGEGLPCHCPYCGFTAGQNQFFTQEQIEYAKSVAFHDISDALIKDVRDTFEPFEIKPTGLLGIGLRFTVQGKPHPIKFYREKRLETEIICEHCTLRYAIYGVFAHCPDCGEHNSFQILGKNLDLCLKEVELAAKSEQSLSDHLVGDALENAVSAFDGFGREVCRVYCERTGQAGKSKLSFQNLQNARDTLANWYGFDLSAAVAPDEWLFACRCFQKRHLLAHKMGVVDEAYLRNTRDQQARIGRKVSITPAEVKSLSESLRKLGAALTAHLK